MFKTFLIIFLFFGQFHFVQAIESKTVRIVSTTNVHGETDPCG